MKTIQWVDIPECEFKLLLQMVRIMYPYWDCEAWYQHFRWYAGNRPLLRATKQGVYSYNANWMIPV